MDYEVYLNLVRPSDAHMDQWTKLSLFKIIACRLFGAKPLSEPVLTYYQLHPKEYISMKFYLKCKTFHKKTIV